MNPGRLILTAAVIVLCVSFEMRAIRAYVVGVTRILQSYGSRAAQTARSAPSSGGGR